MGPRRWRLLWGFQAVLLLLAALPAGQRLQERPPRAAGWSPAPSSSWAPTVEPGAPGDSEGSAAALAFLHTGDAERLARANCSGGVAAGAPGAGPPPGLRAALRAAPEALAHAANFLNMLFQTNDIREASVAEDVEWYQALVRSLAEGHPWVRRAVLALDAHPLAPKPRLMLQATKGDGQILLQDVSSAAPSLGNLSWDNEWFNALKSQRAPALSKRVLSNDLRSLETPKWQRGDSYVGDSGHVRWSPPFLECREGRFLPAWAVTLSSAFYGLKPDLSPEFKGVVRVDVELRDVTIDQCSSGPGWFSDTHRCDLNSTQCVPQESRGFVLGRYLCRCKPGFYGAGGVASGAWAGVPGTDGGSRLGCRPCPPGCGSCEDDTPCLAQQEPVLRAAVLACQACCMLAIFLSMLVSYHFRRSKRIRTSGIILLETILFGSLLLYFPVFILYFKPSVFRCIVLRWVRMLGFAIVYGTITLKLYRVLKVFLSRSAQRAPYVSSGRVLRLLAPVLLGLLWFLAAWTVAVLQNSRRNIPLVVPARTGRGLRFSICGHDCWDYMMVIAELLVLLWGSFLCYATRAVPSAFHEPRYMGIALHNELMVSAAFHLVRFLVVPSLHPDWTLLLFFAHTHGTVTMTLALLFIPKFLHSGSPLREEITAEVYEDELDMRRSGSCLNSSIASAWSERSLDPDDIREELKKLYRQLEVHKTWRMATNNPHLAKKRSSRRSLARSILRRSGAELAENSAGDRAGGTLSRRSSAGERSGASLSRRSSSAKRLGDGSSLRMRDESSRRRSSALRKSRSSEGPRRGSPSPEEPRPAAGTELEQSDSDSLDAAPVLCKSASAQNLSGPWQRPPGRAPPPLQKSHSVVTGAREVALLAARRATTPSDTATARSREDTAPPGEARGHKHVTYAPIKSVSVDSAHPARKVRVTVKKIPPPPPVRYQSLQRSGTLGDSPEPPPGPPAQGTAGDDTESVSPPAGKGSVVTPSATSALACPWELVQDEILSRKQKAAESETPGDTAATSPGSKPPPQKSFRSLGLAIKALNRSRGKSILKGKSEGSLRKRGSGRREKSGPAVSPGGLSREPPALQHNNNAATPGEAAGWGDRATGGQWESLAPGTGDGDKAAEEPRGALEPPSAGHQGDECPQAVARVQKGDEAPAVDVPGVTEEEGTPEEPGGSSRSFQPREQPQEEPAKPSPSSGRGAEVRPPGSLGIPAGRGALLRQEAIATPEDGGTPESPDKALEKGSSQAEPERGSGRSGSAQGELSPGGTRGDSRSKPGICPGKGGRKGDSQRSAAVEKAPELPKAAPEQAEGSRAEVCPWDSREQGTGLRAQICPWDTEGARSEQEGQGSPKTGDVEQLGMGLAGKAPALPKPPSQLAGTAESKKAKICPWEMEEEQRPKTEICPWEEAAAPSGKERLRQDTRGTSKGEEKLGSRAPEKGKGKALPKSPSGKSQSSEKAEICPWESQDLKSSDKAEICPWESQDSKSSDKAEICPWEVAEPQMEKGTAPGKERWPGKVTKLLEKGRKERESICSWESLNMEQLLAKLQTGSSALPKAAPGKSQSTESLKAEICPWESQDSSKSSDKAEICPWEVAEPQMEKGTAARNEKLPGKETKAVEKGSRDREQPLVKPQIGSSALPKAAPGKSQSSEKAEICPWESQDLKSTGKAEICPWESQDSKSSDKAEICPWEVAEPQLEKGTGPGKEKHPPKEASKAVEKGSRDRESICPWESQDTEQPPAKSQTGSSALPKAALGKSQSSEKAEICPWEVEPSSKAEICPWESQDSKSSDRAEICPWEVAELQLEKGTAPGKERLPPKEASKALEKGSRDRESICPWESQDMEQPPAKPQIGSSALPKAALGKSQSSEKAEICPWEVESSSKAEICPWEVAEPPSQQPKAKQGPGGGSKGDKRIRRQAALGSTERALDSRDRESICPWESLDTEQPPAKPQTGSSALPKAAPEKSQSTESLRAEICPWESQDLKSTGKAEICPWVSQDSKSSEKAEICPWEVAAPELEKETDLRKGKLPGKATKALEKSSKERESICPWESLDTEQPPAKSQTGSSALPKAAPGKSQSSEKAEICPWESQDLKSTGKAEICPWEVAEPQLETGTAPGKGKLPGKEASKGLEKSSRDRESICPWESLDTEQPPAKPQTGSSALPKAAPGKSQSTESLRAEICPWESQDSKSSDKAEICPWESQDSKSSDKAEICPWEVAEPQMEKGTDLRKGKLPGKATKAQQKSSKERESICPWESQDTEQSPAKPQIGSSALPKAAPGKSQSSEKAEICPWESQDLKSSDKAEICPWESQDLKSSDKVEICPWESQDSKSSDRAEICPWEVAEPQLEKGTGPGKEKHPSKEASKALEKGSKERESICPWESQDMEQLPAKPQTGSSALPKAAPGKSQSTESLKAEICPWESQDSKSSDRAEICPWEVAEPQMEKGTAPGKGKLAGREASKTLEKSSKERESICPWESLDMEQLPAKPQTGSSALPKAAPGKSQSSEKAEICPWESQDLKSTDKAEICPWEVAEPQAEKGTGPGKEKLPGKVTKAVEKGSRDRESICPWESPDTEELSLKTAVGKEPSQKSASTESRKSEICPWEAAEPLGSEEEISQPGVQPQGAPRASPAGVGQPGASAVSPTLLEKSRGRSHGEAVHKPLCRLVSGIQHPGVGSSSSPSSGRAEVCPWEAAEAPSAPAKPGWDTGRSSEVCPWEEQSTDPNRSYPGQGRAGGSPRDEGGE